MLRTASAIVTSALWVQLVVAQSNSDWYRRLPNDKLDGVPDYLRRSEKQFPKLKDLFLTMNGRSGHSPAVLKEARKRQKVQEFVDDSVPFFCNVSNSRSKERPTSVHTLRPGDIDITASIGDSLTAGNGAFAYIVDNVLVENKGVVTMNGGQGNWRKFLTLPNIFKEFNPKLFGYSTGDSYSHHKASQFNVAEIGAMSQDLPYMTRQLVNRIKNDRRVDFKNHWKFVTILIGSNNFCTDICYLQDAFTSVQMHRDTLYETFRYLRDNMPRTFVNYIVSPNLDVIVKFKGVPSKCQLLHKFECYCLFTLPYKSRYNEFVKVMEEWKRVEEEVAYDKEFRDRDDFAVVVQEFTRNISFPLKRDPETGAIVTDFTYLSDDCFHFSQKGYAKATRAIWNNLLEPVGAKSVDWRPMKKFLCPTERSPYIYTWKNSQINFN